MRGARGRSGSSVPPAARSARTSLRLERIRWTCAPAFLAVVAAGCAARAEPETPDLEQLEHLAFVPAGECAFQPGAGARLSCSNARPLLVDRFEVTRAQWRGWHAARTAPRDEHFEAFFATWTLPTVDWPASYMTLPEAREFAASRGMRLLTAREWMRIASGTGERPFVYPWGGGKARSVANTLDLDLGSPLPVGTFEQGRTPLSIYDMAGNVWEWVEDPIALPKEGDDRSGVNSDLSWAMGGSYLAYLRRLYDDSKGLNYFFEQDLDPRTRAQDVGLRCCADAEEYLVTHARNWGGEGVRERLRAIGAEWGREAVPLLEELVRRADAAPGLRTLLEGARS